MHKLTLNQDLSGFEGWMDKKLILIGLASIRFHNHLALAIKLINLMRLSGFQVWRQFQFSKKSALKLG
jgi:hypothetical protein